MTPTLSSAIFCVAAYPVWSGGNCHFRPWRGVQQQVWPLGRGDGVAEAVFLTRVRSDTVRRERAARHRSGDAAREGCGSGYKLAMRAGVVTRTGGAESAHGANRAVGARRRYTLRPCGHARLRETRATTPRTQKQGIGVGSRSSVRGVCSGLVLVVAGSGSVSAPAHTQGEERASVRPRNRARQATCSGTHILGPTPLLLRWPGSAMTTTTTNGPVRESAAQAGEAANPGPTAQMHREGNCSVIV